MVPRAAPNTTPHLLEFTLLASHREKKCWKARTGRRKKKEDLGLRRERESKKGKRFPLAQTKKEEKRVCSHHHQARSPRPRAISDLVC